MPTKLINGLAAGSDQDVGLQCFGGRRWRAYFGDTLVYGAIPEGDCPRITTDATDPIVVSEGEKTTFKVCLDRQPKGVVELTVQFMDHPRNPVELADTPAVPDNAVEVAGFFYVPRSADEAFLFNLINSINEANPDEPPLTVEQYYVQFVEGAPAPPRFVVSEFVSTLIFTPTDYECKTVTLQAIDVPDVTDLYTVLTITGPPGEVVNSITRRVHVRNDDMLVSRLEVNRTSLELGTGGDVDFFSTRLTARPSADVTVAFSELTNATIDRESLTFRTHDWGALRTITVTSGDKVSMETLTLTPSGGGVDVTPATVDINIVAKPQVSISPDSLTLLEGETKEVQVRVANAPDSYSVIVRVDEISPLIYAGPQVLTFTDSRTQIVRVTALEDVLSGSQDGAAQVRFILSGAGDDFTKVLPVAVVNIGASPLLAAAPTYLPMDAESTAPVTVKLTNRPYADVTVRATLPTRAGTLSASELTFTRDNWNTAQELIVTAVALAAGANDVLAELKLVGSGGGVADTATVSVLVASTAANQVSLVVLDSAVTLPAGTAGQVGVQLSGPPYSSFSLGQGVGSTVTVAISSDDAAKVAVSPASMTFDVDDWNTPKDVMLTAATSTSDDTATITLTPSGMGSDGVARQIAVNVTGVAADAPTPTALPVFRHKTRRPVMDPGGPYVRGQYVLSRAPDEPVVMRFTVATAEQLRERGQTFTTNPIVLQGEPVTLRFDADNYNDGLVLSTRADADAAQRFSILRYEVIEGGPLWVTRIKPDGEYVGFFALGIRAEDLNDVHPIFHASAISMSENETVTVGVSLELRPNNNITVRVTEQSTLLSVGGAMLTFTPQNWNIAQNITLMGLTPPTGATMRRFNVYAHASGQGASPEPAVLEVEVLSASTQDAPLRLAVTFGAIVPDPPGVTRSETFREAFLTWEGPPETGTTVGFTVVLEGPGGLGISRGGIDSSGSLRLFYQTSTREVLNAGRSWTATVTRYKEGRRQASETIAFTPPDADGIANPPVISGDSGPKVPASFRVSFGSRRTRNGVDFIDGIFSWGRPPSLPNAVYVLAFQGPFGTSAGEGRDDMGTQNTSAKFELYAGEDYTASVYAVGASDDAATLTFTTPS